MPISTSTTFTCDRDGVVSDPVTTDAAAAPMPPRGWARLYCDETVDAGGAGQLNSVTGYLCPTCVAGFRDWLGVSSPMFKASEGAKP